MLPDKDLQAMISYKFFFYHCEPILPSRDCVSPQCIPPGAKLRREYVGLEPVSWSTRSGFSIVPDYSQKLITSSFTYICLYKLHLMDPEDPYSDPDHFQNSIISSFYLFRHILKISSKSVHKFFSYLVHKHIWQPGST